LACFCRCCQGVGLGVCDGKGRRGTNSPGDRNGKKKEMKKRVKNKPPISSGPGFCKKKKNKNQKKKKNKKL
jgi:hypothetical protein